MRRVSRPLNSAVFVKQYWLLCRAADSRASRPTTRHFLRPRSPLPTGTSRTHAPQIASTISTALKSSERLTIIYHSRGAAKPTARVVEPYGVLIEDSTLSCREADTEGPLRYYVAERIQSAELTGESFIREPGFDIDLHAQKAFGAFRITQNMARWYDSNLVWPPMHGPSCFTRLSCWKICQTTPLLRALTLLAIWRCVGISIRWATTSKSFRLRCFEKWSSRTGDQIF
jgi:hypothetical protein